MLKILTKREFARKIGLSLDWVYRVMGRAEFQKHLRGKSIVVSDFLRKDLEEYLYIKLESSQTNYISRAKYIKLIEEKFSCLD